MEVRNRFITQGKQKQKGKFYTKNFVYKEIIFYTKAKDKLF